MKKEDYSKNPTAERVVGRRPEGISMLSEPQELGYTCPVCRNKPEYKNEPEAWDRGLRWSEYNGFIWCSVCDSDYPSTLCELDTHKAVTTYLKCVEEAKFVGAINIGESEEDKKMYDKAAKDHIETHRKADLLTHITEHIRTADPEIRLSILSLLGEDLKKRLLGEESKWFREEMEAGR